MRNLVPDLTVNRMTSPILWLGLYVMLLYRSLCRGMYMEQKCPIINYWCHCSEDIFSFIHLTP
jgi:hypothetical protein